ncbi:hypothetical protein EI545_09860 [Tabrizicola piscis]|jgi:hypothetical protein|uniref:Lipoprotein n=1 Tax=Tabrizicola piscis TaxID=2494374 RepID=A0A3S8U6G1_9RHOB|nr:hypothetical protein [Tabrizicola piscis]AZL59119.1 hypothetical protein EI545_09860 [Tabrizicola piscis]
MLRLVLSLVALLGLAACGAEPKWAPEEQVQAARFVAGPPTYVTLYTVVNKSTGSGAHSAILVNGSERVIFDPAGTWTHPRLPERNDVHFGMTDRGIAFYVDYHARETYDVIEQQITVSPEIAELVLRRVKEYGAVPKAMCTAATSSVLRGVPGFESLPSTWYPKKLADAFGALPGVTTRVITDDDDDSNHGVLLVQANGDPLEG